jgi:hypothetical protein
MKVFSIRGKRVSIFNDGQIFVSGNSTNIKVWNSDSKRYSNVKSGAEIKEINGLALEDALYLKGLV